MELLNAGNNQIIKNNSGGVYYSTKFFLEYALDLMEARKFKKGDVLQANFHMKNFYFKVVNLHYVEGKFRLYLTPIGYWLDHFNMTKNIFDLSHLADLLIKTVNKEEIYKLKSNQVLGHRTFNAKFKRK